MKKVYMAGLAAFLPLSAGCSSESLNESQSSTTTQQDIVELEVTGVQNLQLRESSVATNRGGVGKPTEILPAGSHVIALCFAEFKRDPNRSEILVSTGDIIGYAGLYSLNGSKDTTPTPIFEPTSAKALKHQLPSC